MEQPDQPAPSRGPRSGRAERVGAPGPATEAVELPSPSVLAVVITKDPGDWFDAALASLAAQRYDKLQIAVVDAGGSVPLATRVAAAAPAAERLRFETDPGSFGASVNAAVAALPAAELYLICHDDVALEPDAVGLLVDELVRSNAGIVGPKLVDWDEPARLQHVGLSVDRFGTALGVVDPDELDQGQHDAVSDVFAVPSACCLVRADLFATIGGFDPAIAYRGDDVDLCWRAQLAGARVVVVPRAVGRHRERLVERVAESGDVYYLRLRHSMRSAWSCYSIPSLARLAPFAALLALFELVYSLLTGRWGHAKAVVKAWLWNLARARQIIGRRRVIARSRTVDDSEIRAMQARGSTRVRAFVRGHGGDTDRLLAVTQAGREVLTSLRTPGARNRVALGGGVAAVVAFGTRHLLTRPVPRIGEFQPITGTGSLLRDWWSGWHPGGGGSNVGLPTGYALVGLLHAALLHHGGLALKLLALAPLVVGPLGAWRLCRAFGSPLASAVAAVSYAFMPVAFDALSRGAWAGLVTYATLPLLALGVARLFELAPFAVGDPGASGRPRGYDTLMLGLTLAVAMTATPFVAVVVALLALAYVLGSLLTGDTRGVVGLVTGAAAAAGVAALLHLSWVGAWLHAPRTWATVGAAGSADGGPDTLARLLRLSTGPFNAGYLGFVYGVPLVLALFLAQNWRLAWAARGACLLLAGVFTQWAGERGWLPVALPDPSVLLGLAALGFTLGAAIVTVAIENDLRRHRLGWRQAIPFVATTALALSFLPLVRSSLDGRWSLPAQGLDSPLAFLDEPDRAVDGSFRVAWIGHRDVLPVAGAAFDHDPRDGVASDGDLVLAITDNRGPRFVDRWSLAQSPTALGVADAVRDAVAGDTTRLGQDLSRFAVRYVIVVEFRSPTRRSAGEARPVPTALVQSLRGQLDLERVEGVNDAVQIYQNTAWRPVRALVGPGGVANGVLSPRATPPWNGEIATPGELRLAYPFDERFALSVSGRSVPLVAAADFGIKADLSSTTAPADLHLDYRTPLVRRMLLIVQSISWLVVVATILIWRDRLRRAAELGGAA